MARAKSPPRPTAAQKRILVALKVLSQAFPSAGGFDRGEVFCLIDQPKPPAVSSFLSLVRMRLVGSFVTKRKQRLVNKLISTDRRDAAFFLTDSGRALAATVKIKMADDYVRETMALFNEGKMPKHVQAWSDRKLNRMGTFEAHRFLAKQYPDELNKWMSEMLRPGQQKRLF